MRLLTDEEKVVYEALMSGILKKRKLNITKPPKGFEGW